MTHSTYIKSSKYGFLTALDDDGLPVYGDISNALSFSVNDAIDLANELDDPQQPHLNTLPKKGI